MVELLHGLNTPYELQVHRQIEVFVREVVDPASSPVRHTFADDLFLIRTFRTTDLVLLAQAVIEIFLRINTQTSVAIERTHVLTYTQDTFRTTYPAVHLDILIIVAQLKDLVLVEV